jgi:MFS family permease
VLLGLGLILAGFVGNSVVGVTISFGIVMAAGSGISYSSLPPPALKWFHPSRKGLVSGLIVGGYGLSASVYAPVTSALLARYGIRATLVIIGVAALVLCSVISRFITNPPPGYAPLAPEPKPGVAAVLASVANITPDIGWRQMVATASFRLIFVIYLLSSSVGLMVIGNMSKIAQTQVGISDAAALAAIVSFMAVTNTLGRVVGGMLSDSIGRVNCLSVILVLQTVNMAAFFMYQSLALLILGVVFVGFCFGATLSVMPALCADLYGLKNFGRNYGVLFLAWGFAGVLSPVVADLLFDSTGSFNASYWISTAMSFAMIGASFVLRNTLKKVPSA